MTSTALYVLADEYLQAAQQLADLDLDEQTVADTLEGLSGALEAKAVNVAMFARNLEASAEAIKVAEAQMAARRKALERRAASIRAYLLAQMERTGISEIASPYFKLAIRDNPPRVIVDSLAAVPQEFLRYPPPPPVEVVKTDIARAIKAGREVPGCHLEHTRRLDIK